MRAACLALAAFALAGCQEAAAPRNSEPAAAPTPPAPAPPVTAPAAALHGDIEGRGNEPFWFVSVKGGQISLERPDHPALTAGSGPARREGGATVWEAPTVNPPLRVVVRNAPGCSDGMSDLSYPLAVEVTVGGETLKGCGANAGELPRGER